MPKIIGIIIGLIIKTANTSKTAINIVPIIILKFFSDNIRLYDDKSL